MRTIVQRLQAVLLLLTIVGGSFALPLYDAAVYHSALDHAAEFHSALDHMERPTNSVAGQTAATGHAQVCALDLASRCGSGIAPFTGSEIAPSLSVRTPILRPILVAPTQTWLASTHSRAPPRSLS